MMEAWQSGRLRRSWKPLGPKKLRRFESYSLRAKNLSDGQHNEINCPENNHYISMVVIEKLWVLF